MYKTREEVENWLNEMNIDNYVINKDLTVDVHDDVNIALKNINYLPIKFKNVNGSFNCSNNRLTSLEGCPEKISGAFHCYMNKLTNLKGCPQVIKGSLFCHYNSLTNLEGCPEVINGDFHLLNNHLTNFEYFPQKVKGSCLSFTGNNIEEKELLNFNCDISLVSKIYSSFNTNGNKEEFLEKVYFHKSKKENELLKKLNVNSSINIKLNNKL